ncbi:MAG: hypothetical protein Q8M29_08175 [Bacteroidota bacterium]|nr:hypothetical protein [Bacteroidota bacterium]
MKGLFLQAVKETWYDIAGIHIQEPVTVLTNMLIVATSVFLYYKVGVKNTEKSLLVKYWRLFFFFFGLNALIGSVAHGFKSYFSPDIFYYVWLCMNLASVPITYYLLRANIELSKFTTRNKKISEIIVLCLSIVFAVLTAITNNFAIVKINALIAILITIVSHYRAYRDRRPGSGYITFGFTFSILALVVHGAKLSLSDWFNFKDISHVIMNITLCIIYAGVLLELRFLEEAQTEKV